MVRLVVRAVREGDLEAVAAGMRSADLDEIEATTGETDPRPALQQGIEISTLVWTIEIDGAAAGLFGVAPANEHIGVPWLLGTVALERIPKQLVRQGRGYVHRMREKYPTLVNYVDARNLKSVYWLARLGFTVSPHTEPYGVSGLPFHRFGMTR